MDLEIAAVTGREGRKTTTGPEDRYRALAAEAAGRFAPAHVLVTREGEIVYFSKGSIRYFEIAPGAPTQQLVGLARSEVKPHLRSAFRQALNTETTATSQGVLAGDDGVDRDFDIVIEPIADDPGGRTLFVVLFLEKTQTSPAIAASRGDCLNDGPQDSDLASTRQRLAVLKKDYDAALQELGSANQALAILERESKDLQISQHDLGDRLEALDQARDDLLGLLESTAIPTVVVDRDLLIRRFTPSATALFNLRPGDLGRPLTDLNTPVSSPAMVDAIQSVLATGATVEQTVYQEGAKAHLLLRVAPYRSADQRFDGIIFTFVDITRLTHDRAKQQMVTAELHHWVKNMLTVVIGLAQQTHQAAATPQSFIEAFTGRLQAMARSYDLISHGQWIETSLDLLVRTELAPFDVERVTLDGPPIVLDPEVTLSLGMVLHELVTNAGKYGALSAPNGEVFVGWSQDESKPGKTLVLQWIESNGPVVVRPARPGFGLKFVDREVAYNLVGQAELDFQPGGLRARISLPLERIR